MKSKYVTKDFVLPIAQMQIEKSNLCLVYLSLTAILRELPVCAMSNMLSRKELLCQEKCLKLRHQEVGFLERTSCSSVGSLESGKPLKQVLTESQRAFTLNKLQI